MSRDDSGKPTPSVDELLRMLTQKGALKGTGETSRPPPVPPKPRVVATTEPVVLTTTKSNIDLGTRNFQQYYLGSNLNNFSSPDETNKGGENLYMGPKYDFYKSDLQHDINNHDHKINTPAQRILNHSSLYKTSNSAKSSYEHATKESFMGTSTNAQPGLSVYSHTDSYLRPMEASSPPTEPQINHYDSVEGSDAVGNGNYNSDSHVARPIVTEYQDEANNNAMVKRHPSTTVEILEVSSPKNQATPRKSPSKTHSTTFSRSTSKEPTHDRHKLFYENNSYVTPLVTTSTDDEESDPDINNTISQDQVLPTQVRVSALLNDVSPRTSTPTASHRISINNTGAENSSNEEDAANTSRETDDLNNTSGLNRSGGCELVGVAVDSDQANNSKDSTRSEEKLPYTVKLFNDNTMSSSRSPTTINEHQSVKEEVAHKTRDYSAYQDKVKQLEQTTGSLLGVVDKLQSQVEKLTSRVEELEDELAETKSSVSRHGTSNQLMANASNDNLSKSMMTINKISVSPSVSRVNSTVINPSSTYSRSSVAKISKNQQDHSPLHINSTKINQSMLSQSSNLALSRPLKKSNIHASTSSLCSESMRSCASISPTNYPSPLMNSQQHLSLSRPISGASPSSFMSIKRDLAQPTPYASMLSLCSSNQSTSTLKKASIAGSVSNLSQVGGQLNGWPSLDNFIPSKHRCKEITYDEEEKVVRMLLYNSLITMAVPSYSVTRYNLDRVVEPPSIRLKLDWVYGYRGRDCRTNIFYLPTGECVYFVAAIVVLYNVEEKTQRHYLGHTDSVKCLAVHPNKLIVASGQSAVQNRRDKRPIVRVWNTISLATLRVIGFNEDFDRSICCLAFSKHDQGATLAVVDESSEHTITLLDWQRERNWRLAEVNSGHEPVLAIDFHPIDKYSLVAVGKSGINFWDIRGMTMVKKAGLFDKYDKPKYVLCFTFNEFGDTITGDSNGNLIIWARGDNHPKKMIRDIHHGGIFSVLAMRDGSYLTGGRDRKIIEWDQEFNQTGRLAELPEHCGGVRFITFAKGSQVLIGTLRNCILLGSLDKNFRLVMQGHTEATSSIAVHPINHQYLTGGFDDQIHFFDSTSHEPLWNKCLMMPSTAACFSPNGSLLIIGSTLGKWLVLDAITQEILFTKCDGSGTINCIKFSPNGEYFAMGSGDNQIYLYQTSETGNKFCKIGTCVGHSTPVKEIDWSDDSQYIQSQSMSFELLHWRALNCRPLDDLEMIAELTWSTHNCTIGFNAIGLWSDSIDSALINHCDRSNSDDLLVSVTDSGNINIFKWPTCYNQCLSQKYYGNVDKFNFIKFLANDSKLIAIGAKSCVTTEWIVDKGDALESS